MATIQVRVPDEDKKRSEEILKSLGMDLTTAIRVYLKKITVEGGIPFSLNPRLTVNGFTPEFEAEVLRSSNDKTGSKTFDDVEDLIADLQSDA